MNDQEKRQFSYAQSEVMTCTPEVHSRVLARLAKNWSDADWLAYSEAYGKAFDEVSEEMSEEWEAVQKEMGW